MQECVGAHGPVRNGQLAQSPGSRYAAGIATRCRLRNALWDENHSVSSLKISPLSTPSLLLFVTWTRFRELSVSSSVCIRHHRPIERKNNTHFPLRDMIPIFGQEKFRDDQASVQRHASRRSPVEVCSPRTYLASAYLFYDRCNHAISRRLWSSGDGLDIDCTWR